MRSEVGPIEWAVFEREVNPQPLTRKQYLAVLLSDGIASHCVPIQLIAELRGEYRDDEVVGLCMAAALAHAGHVLNEAVRLSPKEGASCPIPQPAEGDGAQRDPLTNLDPGDDRVEAPVRDLSATDEKGPMTPLCAGESGDAGVDAFLGDIEKGWLQDPELLNQFARVPEGLRGWRRLVEGTVAAIGPVVWELVAHRTAIVTEHPYATSQEDERVRKHVEALLPVISAPEIDPDSLDRRKYLAVTLAEGVARHEVEAELFRELLEEYATSELVALCMAASLTHVSHLVADALSLRPCSEDQAASEKSRER